MNIQAAHRYVASQVQASGTSFYWPMFLQSRPHRQALFAVYMFCRKLDDIADDPGPALAKQKNLERWRDEIERLFSASSDKTTYEKPLLSALADIVQKFDLPKSSFLALIQGMEADVRGPIVAPDWPTLLTYCGQVAGAVGDLCLCIWDWRGEDADRFAQATGEALQLTNILRDVVQDVHEGRLYLPIESLKLAGIEFNHPRDVLDDPNFHQACSAVAAVAQERFATAEDLWRASGKASARPAWVMLQLYKALFVETVDNGFDLNRGRARLSGTQKVYHLFKAYLTAG